MIAKLICLLFGHRRGKFVALANEAGSDKVMQRTIGCPRCKATWTRKVKA